MHSAMVWDGSRTRQVKDADIPRAMKDKKAVLWVDIKKPKENDIALLEKTFKFHPLSIDDCLHYTKLPKADDFDAYVFIVFHRIFFDKREKSIQLAELDIFLGSNFIVTVHNGDSPGIDAVAKKVRESSLPIKHGADFVLHAILDFNTDNYFPLLEHLDGRIEQLEDRILKGRTKNVISEIMVLKRQISELKRSLSPQRDVVNRIARNEFKQVSEKASIYFRDIYDHLMRAHSELDDFRDLLTGVYEAHLSIISNKMNEIMQKLTVVATIFIPLTFITGVYGMNFLFMPELKIWWAYPLVWAVMIGVGVSMFLYFRKKKWA